MSDYFIKTKRPVWNINDAFNSFNAENPDLTVDQQLTRFHNFLKKQDDPLVQSWLLNWKSFCKKSEKPKETPHTNVNLDMRRSVNPNVTIGNVSNYNNKRELEDDVERAPQKRANKQNSAIRSDTESFIIDERPCPPVPSTGNQNELFMHATESDSLSESSAAELTAKQPIEHPVEQPIEHPVEQPTTEQSPEQSAAQSAALTTDELYINNQDDIWACWRMCVNNGSLPKYSLERLGIIQCGKTVQCRDYYPSELYDLLPCNSPKCDNPVSNNTDIFDPIFDESSNKSMMSKKLYQIAYEDKQDPQVLMVSSVLEVFLKSVFSGVCITGEESNYSHYVIWPLIDTIIATADATLNFHCGEYRLKSVDKELSRRTINSKEHYKSDGCISTLVDGVQIELLLLEVSGPFNLDDEGRFVKDHVKAGYGLVAMLNEIAYTYKFASFDTFTAIRLFFLHSKKNKLRFWSFEMPAPGLYVLNLINSATIPDNCDSCELPVESLCIELWNLKTMLQQTIDAIDEIKQSHIVNQRAYNRSLRHSPNLKPILLTDSLKINPKVKLDVDYIVGYDELAINSSLF